MWLFFADRIWPPVEIKMITYEPDGNLEVFSCKNPDEFLKEYKVEVIINGTIHRTSYIHITKCVMN